MFIAVVGIAFVHMHSRALTVILVYHTVDDVEFVQCVTNTMQIYKYTGSFNLMCQLIKEPYDVVEASWEKSKTYFPLWNPFNVKVHSLTPFEAGVFVFFLTNNFLSLLAPSWLSQLHHTHAASSSSQDDGWCVTNYVSQHKCIYWSLTRWILRGFWKAMLWCPQN